MAAINSVVDLTREDDIAVLTVDHPPVNALSHAVREGIVEGFRAANADAAAKAIVLICAGRTFMAGADIAEFGKPPKDPTLLDIEDAMESAAKPIVAAIHGTALGGGLEIALCAHYRIAVGSARCGLPEVNIGLLPGAGGTQRLPRIVGVEKALEIITSGKPLPAKECLALGLIDAIMPEGDLRGGAITFAREIVTQGKPLRRIRDSDEKLLAARGHPEIFEAFRKAHARKFRGFAAPDAIIKSVEAAVNLPFADGMKEERRLFVTLRDGEQSRAQRYAFFAERQAAKIPDLPDDTPLIPIRKVGVIGAGTMGGGIAMNFASAGIPVTLVEAQQDALDRGVKTVRGNYERSAKSGRMTESDVEQRMARITPSPSFDDLSDCDLVIEAVFERMDIKRDVFTRLDAIVKQGAILATNTSYLDVNVIAAATKRPESVIGLHFFSPANVMRLLEVVRGNKTSKPVISTCMKLAKTIGKIAVLVGVGPGFVGNRMLARRRREADALVLEGALPWDVDRVLYEFGFPMGPFAVSDLAGLDLGWVREESKSATIREMLCEMDRRGQKTGAGFYDYDEKRNAQPSPATEKIIAEFRAKQGVTPRAIADDEILERCLYPMINEGAQILEDGKAIRASDIDVVWLNGYGWPVYRGGPMYYADQIGLDRVLARMQQWQQERGDDFQPSALLERLVADNKKFGDLAPGEN